MLSNCPNCGRQLTQESVNYCPICGYNLAPPEGETAADKDRWQQERLVDLSEVPPIPSDLENYDPRTGPAWENPGEEGRFRDLFVTIKEVLFNPVEFFQTLNHNKGLFAPLIYAIIISWITGMIALVWNQLFSFEELFDLGQYGQQGFPVQFQHYILIAYFFLIPLLTILSLFIGSAIYHVVLLIFSGDKYGFEATFRVICYGSSANVFNIVPIIGGLITTIYTIILYIIGIKETHEIDGWKAALVVFLPIIFICCCCIGFGLLLIPMIASEFGQMSN